MIYLRFAVVGSAAGQEKVDTVRLKENHQQSTPIIFTTPHPPHLETNTKDITLSSTIKASPCIYSSYLTSIERPPSPQQHHNVSELTAAPFIPPLYEDDMPSSTTTGANATPNGSAAKSRDHNQGNQDRKYTVEQKTAVIRVRRCATTAFYEILGLERTASDVEIKKAYRKLSLLTHPDKNGYEGADEAFKSE